MISSATFSAIACVLLAIYVSFLFISRRRLQTKLTRAEKTVIEYTTQLAESKALFGLSQEENEDLKRRLDGVSVLLSKKEGALEKEIIASNWARQSLAQKEVELSGVQQKLAYEQEQYRKLIGQKKSSEVRTGKITEQISPFLADYPFDPKNARFLGDPLDFVSFDDDKITFVEVKSGKSQLNKRQRHFRDLIKEGKVEFFLYRVSGEGK